MDTEPEVEDEYDEREKRESVEYDRRFLLLPYLLVLVLADEVDEDLLLLLELVLLSSDLRDLPSLFSGSLVLLLSLCFTTSCLDNF